MSDLRSYHTRIQIYIRGVEKYIEYSGIENEFNTFFPKIESTSVEGGLISVKLLNRRVVVIAWVDEHVTKPQLMTVAQI